MTEKVKKKRPRPKNIICANPRCRKDKPGRTASCQWRKGWKPENGDPVLLCNACGVRFSRGHWCPYCYFIYKSDDADLPGNPWLHCRGCKRRVHTKCFLKDPSRTLPKSGEHFFCLFCEANGITEPQKPPRNKLRSNTKNKKVKSKQSKDSSESRPKSKRSTSSSSSSNPKKNSSLSTGDSTSGTVSSSHRSSSIHSRPSSKKNSHSASETISEVEAEEVNAFCMCNSSTGGFMIDCDGCSRYFHPECVQLDRHNLPSTWFCPFCEIDSTPVPHYPPGTPLNRSPKGGANRYIGIPNMYHQFYQPSRSPQPFPHLVASPMPTISHLSRRSLPPAQMTSPTRAENLSTVAQAAALLDSNPSGFFEPPKKARRLSDGSKAFITDLPTLVAPHIPQEILSIINKAHSNGNFSDIHDSSFLERQDVNTIRKTVESLLRTKRFLLKSDLTILDAVDKEFHRIINGGLNPPDEAPKRSLSVELEAQRIAIKAARESVKEFTNQVSDARSKMLELQAKERASILTLSTLEGSLSGGTGDPADNPRIYKGIWNELIDLCLPQLKKSNTSSTNDTITNNSQNLTNNSQTPRKLSKSARNGSSTPLKAKS